MKLDKAICMFGKGAKHTWNGKPTVEAEYCQQMVEWLKELKEHREAWEKVLDEMMNVSIPGQDAEYVYEKIYDIIKKYRPKEGDAE